MARKTTFDVPLPAKVTEDEREAIGNAIIDYITERSQADSNNAGRPFTGYTEKYAEWKGQENVDLTLSSDMLAEMEAISMRGKLRIGYSKGNEEQGKAEGNHYGTYGKPKPKTPRPFLGFVGKERKQLTSIIRAYTDLKLKEINAKLKGKIAP